MKIEAGDNDYTITPHEAQESQILYTAAKRYLLKAATSPLYIPDSHAQTLAAFMVTNRGKTAPFTVKPDHIDAYKDSLQSVLPDLNASEMATAQNMIDHITFAQTDIVIPNQLPEGWSL